MTELDRLLTVLYTTNWSLLPTALYLRWIGDLWDAIEKAA